MGDFYTSTPSLTIGEALNNGTSKLLTFEGRARRSEFWWMKFIAFVVSCVLTPLAGFVMEILMIPITVRRLHDTGNSGWWVLVGFLLNALFIGLLLYDYFSIIFFYRDEFINANQSVFDIISKYIILGIFNCIYGIMMLLLLCKDSDAYENQYGESPKYVFDKNSVDE